MPDTDMQDLAPALTEVREGTETCHTVAACSMVVP